MDIIILLECVLLASLLGLSGFFSSSETALFSLNSLQREQLGNQKTKHANLIDQLLSQPRRLIVTILIGNELVNVSASVVCTLIIIQTLGADKSWLNLFIMLPLLLLFGEITPKTLAMRHNVRVACAISVPLNLFSKLITPVRWLVRQVADRFITLLVGKERSQGNLITEDMVRTLAHAAVGEGTLPSIEAEFIDQIFDFGDQSLQDIITPRSTVFMLSVDTPISRVINEVRRYRYSRIPVYDDNRDHILGILHSRDLIGLDLNELMQQPDSLRSLLRKPYFVPNTKTAPDLFHTLRTRKLSLAIVVDEYGGMVGMVSMEDLLTCIFGGGGNIDTHQSGRIRPLGKGRYHLDGHVKVSEFNKKLSLSLSEQITDTVAGLLLHEHGELPEKNTLIDYHGLHFTILEVRNNRITRILLETTAH